MAVHRDRVLPWAFVLSSITPHSIAVPQVEDALAKLIPHSLLGQLGEPISAETMEARQQTLEVVASLLEDPASAPTGADGSSIVTDHFARVATVRPCLHAGRRDGCVPKPSLLHLGPILRLDSLSSQPQPGARLTFSAPHPSHLKSTRLLVLSRPAMRLPACPPQSRMTSEELLDIADWGAIAGNPKACSWLFPGTMKRVVQALLLFGFSDRRPELVLEVTLRTTSSLSAPHPRPALAAVAVTEEACVHAQTDRRDPPARAIDSFNDSGDKHWEIDEQRARRSMEGRDDDDDDPCPQAEALAKRCSWESRMEVERAVCRVLAGDTDAALSILSSAEARATGKPRWAAGGGTMDASAAAAASAMGAVRAGSADPGDLLPGLCAFW